MTKNNNISIIYNTASGGIFMTPNYQHIGVIVSTHSKQLGYLRIRQAWLKMVTKFLIRNGRNAIAIVHITKQIINI